MSKKEELEKEQMQQQEEFLRRTPTPRSNQVIGVCEQRLGGSRMRVRCMDGKTRICRIPGRHKRRLWIRENDVLLVEPWELGGDAKGDVVYKYKKIQVNYLKKKGLFKALEVDEF